MKLLFGYVFPYKEELKIKEYNVFKGYYCGLCKVLGKEFNQLVRLGLNYDLTFLALLLSSLNDERDVVRAEGCITNPIKKKPIVQSNIYLQYSAHMGIVLAYFKLLDDWKDEKSVKALLALLAYLLPVRKVKKAYNKKFNSIKKYLDQLSSLENNRCRVIDESAHTFAKLMGELAVPPFIEDESKKRVLTWLGYNLGRWIYILDAFNDIERDIKNNNYNPIILQYEYNENENIEDFKTRVKEPIEFSLIYTLENIAKSFELLDIKYNKGLLENIIYIGTRHKMDMIMGKGGAKCEKSI